METSKSLTNLAKWIGTVNGALAIILGVISVHEKSKLILTLIVVFLFLAVLAFLIYYAVLWKVSEKEKRSLKKEVRRLRKETCKNCKRIYFSDFDESISFYENFDKYFFPYEGNSEDTIDIKVIYYLDEYFFIIFCDEKDIDGKCYLINLIDSSIYLPVDNNEWKEVLGKGVSYRQLCSKRKNHFDNSDQLL